MYCSRVIPRPKCRSATRLRSSCCSPSSRWRPQAACVSAAASTRNTSSGLSQVGVTTSTWQPSDSKRSAACAQRSRTSGSTVPWPQVGRPGDAQAGDARIAGLEERRAAVGGDRVAVAIVGPGDRVEHQGRVAHRARHRPRVRDRLPAAEARELRHPPERRLEPVDPAERRGDPDGAAAVGAHGERPEPRRHRRARAPARSARVSARDSTGSG